MNASQQTVQVSFEMTQEGFKDLMRLCDRYAMAGANVAPEMAISIAIQTGLTMQHQALDAAANEGGFPWQCREKH